MKKNVVSLEDRIPQLKETRRQKAKFRLKVLLTIFFVLMVLIVYFNSSFSKLGNIKLSGNSYVTLAEIKAWGDIQEEDLFITFNSKDLQQRLEEHKEIHQVKISKSFPNTLRIEIAESKPIGYAKTETIYAPILESGVIKLEMGTATPSTDLPIFFGFSSDEYLANLVGELSQVPADILNRISEVHYDPKETDPSCIYMYMNDGMKVVGNINNLAQNLSYYPNLISQLQPGEKGIIDIEVGMYFKAY